MWSGDLQHFRRLPSPAQPGLLQEVLQRRRTIYASRVIIPADLQAVLGRIEITRSLRTGNRPEALRRLALWEARVRSYLTAVRRHAHRMTPAELDALARQYLHASFHEIEVRLTLDWEEPGLDAHRFDLVEKAERLHAALCSVDYTLGMEGARGMLPAASEETLRRLARRLIEAELEAIKAELGALNGEPLTAPVALLPEPLPAAPQATPTATPTFSAVATEYGNERVRDGFWTPKTEFQSRKIYTLLANLLGDPPIGEVTKDAIRNLGQDIVALPSNMTKRFPGLSPQEVLQKLEGDTGTPRLEPRSVNKYRQLARSLFKWAVEHDYISTNPAVILRDVKEGRARDDRKAFTDEDLTRYFGHLPQHPGDEPFLYWIPRILAYSGMRLNEAAKLRKEDARLEDGHWIFDVNEEGDGRRLKTEASIRLVPVHSRLIDLGLMEFIQGAPEGFLWPADMRTTKNRAGGDMDKLSKLLGRRLRSSGVKDPRKTGAHSFRHTVATRLKQFSIPEYQIADLIGHDDESQTTGRYGKEVNVPRLREIVELLNLPV